MKRITTIIATIVLVSVSSTAFASNCRVKNYNGRISYQGCSASEMRAIQSGQFRTKTQAKAVGQLKGDYKAKHRVASNKASDINHANQEAFEKKQKEIAKRQKKRNYGSNKIVQNADGTFTQISSYRTKVAATRYGNIHRYRTEVITSPKEVTAEQLIK